MTAMAGVRHHKTGTEGLVIVGRALIGTSSIYAKDRSNEFSDMDSRVDTSVATGLQAL
jgi:hypothetical protein